MISFTFVELRSSRFGEAVKFPRLPKGIISGTVLEVIPLMSLATYLLTLLRNLMPKPGAWMSSPVCVGETLGCQQHSSSGRRKKKRPLCGLLNVGRFLGIFQESRGCRDSCFPPFS